MEFVINLNEIFRSSISIIDYTLLPSNFSGDPRSALHCASQIATIIDAMGTASAKAQNLQRPIISAEKMRNFDHTLYLMIEPADNSGRGSVVGVLKVGMKNLFLFDETGLVHEKKCLSILDFYVHESKQRAGFGKKIYDYMLHDKDIEPSKLAFDQPSEKCLSFLYKHYGLSKIYPQSNNFVLFEGFFDEKHEKSTSTELLDHQNSAEHSLKGDHQNCFDNHSVRSDEYRPTSFGRHTAYKPCDTMGKGLEWVSPAKHGRQFDMNHHTPLW